MTPFRYMYLGVGLPEFTEFVTKEMQKRFPGVHEIVVMNTYLDHQVGDRVVVHVTYKEPDKEENP